MSNTKKLENGAATEMIMGAYLIKGTMGTDRMGAARMNFTLVVVPSNESITGEVEITQAISGPNAILRFPVTGEIKATGLGDKTQAVSLSGKHPYAAESGVGLMLLPFTANMSIDNKWNGTGSCQYGINGEKKIENATVKPV